MEYGITPHENGSVSTIPTAWEKCVCLFPFHISLRTLCSTSIIRMTFGAAVCQCKTKRHCAACQEITMSSQLLLQYQYLFPHSLSLVSFLFFFFLWCIEQYLKPMLLLQHISFCSTHFCFVPVNFNLKSFSFSDELCLTLVLVQILS